MGLSEFVRLAVRLDGEPFTLDKRPYLNAVYESQARCLALRASRQVEKSTFLVNKILYEVYRRPGFKVLFIAPRLEQAEFFSKSRLHAVLEESPLLKRRLWPWKRKIPVLDIPLANRSRISVRAAYHSGDSCRGISADMLCVDEVQDVAAGSLPVLRETLSHSSHGMIVLTGTPKMADNHLETFFRMSTANEWHVQCAHCLYDCLMDERVMGPHGLLCPRCQQPLDAQAGRWVARNPGSQWGHGFTICHLMVPWMEYDEILERQRTYDRAKFVNEVLGQSSTLGDHIITREEIEACCEDRPFANSLEDIGAPYRRGLIAGIDWGGGSASGTVMVIGHFIRDLTFQVVRFDRWLPHTDPNDVLEQVSQRLRQLRVVRIAADGLGNGTVYNRLLYQRLGGPQSGVRLCGIIYSAETQELIADGYLSRWSVNRSHHIGALFSRIKARLIRFPRVEACGAFLDEFTCELAEWDDAMRSMKYTKPDAATDDALHATLYADLLGLRLRSQGF